MVKTFYGKEHYVVLYYVQKNKCIKEDDLRQLIKFDQRFLRTVIFHSFQWICVISVHELTFEKIYDSNSCN